MKTTILSASLLLLLSSCTPTKTTNNLNAIDIAGSFEHLTELKVSQLGKNIRYVPLETTDSSLIGNSYNIKLLKDKILVATEELSGIRQTNRKVFRYHRAQRR